MKVVNNISYHKDTPDAVIAILEKSRKEKLRIVITYGNPTTKEVWESATPEVGYVAFASFSISYAFAYAFSTASFEFSIS